MPFVVISSSKAVRTQNKPPCLRVCSFGAAPTSSPVSIRSSGSTVFTSFRARCDLSVDAPQHDARCVIPPPRPRAHLNISSSFQTSRLLCICGNQSTRRVLVVADADAVPVAARRRRDAQPSARVRDALRGASILLARRNVVSSAP
eukprot:6182679-Pleurochrysis_carterae.AAC.1